MDSWLPKGDVVREMHEKFIRHEASTAPLAFPLGLARRVKPKSAEAELLYERRRPLFYRAHIILASAARFRVWLILLGIRERASA